MATKEDFQKAPTKVIVFSPCSDSKSDKLEITRGFKTPEAYLESHELLEKLRNTRKHILEELGAQKGNKATYALDLYTGRAYAEMRSSGSYDRLKQRLLSGDEIQWFFLSGAYGVINALEKALRYEATFNRSIANKNKIPWTADIWRKTGLSRMCDEIIQWFNLSFVYIFGSRDYTDFIKGTNFWNGGDIKGVKMFESTGQNGTNWLSPRLNHLAEAILRGNLDNFNSRYPKRFYKQGECGN